MNSKTILVNPLDKTLEHLLILLNEKGLIYTFRILHNACLFHHNAGTIFADNVEHVPRLDDLRKALSFLTYTYSSSTQTEYKTWSYIIDPITPPWNKA